MNFPLENPLFRFLYWLINTPGLGGIAVMIVGGGSLIAYFLILRWIAQGAQTDENEEYLFPTSSLIGHDESERPQP